MRTDETMDGIDLLALYLAIESKYIVASKLDGPMVAVYFRAKGQIIKILVIYFNFTRFIFDRIGIHVRQIYLKCPVRTEPIGVF